MKAPDKIYVNIPGDYWHPGSDKKVNTDTEYVRKDALLEMIENARKAAIVQKNFNNCPAEQEARIDAYDYIKHTIESL